MTKMSCQLLLLGSLAVSLSSSIFSPAGAESQKQQYKTQLKIQAKTPTQSRVLEFPEKFSIGRLYVLNKLDLTTHVIETDVAKVRKLAQGQVTIPQKGYAFLVGSYALGESLQPLQKLKGDDLQIIKLSKLTFNEQDLQYLTGITGLQRLELDATDVSDLSLKILAKLPNLVYINLTRTMTTGKNIADLAPLKNLIDLQLGHNALCDGNLHGIAAVQSLKALHVQACQLKDKDLESISQLKNLESLTLNENKKITDNGLKYLIKMPNLHYLNVGQTSVTASGLKTLKGCPIASLRVEKGQVREEELAQLRTIFPKAIIKEEDSGNRMDPTLFAPLH